MVSTPPHRLRRSYRCSGRTDSIHRSQFIDARSNSVSSYNISHRVAADSSACSKNGGRNGEFCVVLGPCDLDCWHTGLSRLKALAVNLSHPANVCCMLAELSPSFCQPPKSL